MSSFRLQIVTPDGSLFDGQAEALRVKTSEGYVSILARHADYIAALDIGMVTVTENGESRNAACGGGFVSVEKGEVRLVATTFEYADSIDVERAQRAKETAQMRLEQMKEAQDILMAKAKLMRAINRLSVAEK